jgi:hypothetical protein
VSDIVPSEEIRRMTGYKRPADQLRELKARGFYRARLAKVTREVILERPHYDAVCAGQGSAANEDRPTVRPLRRVK